MRHTIIQTAVFSNNLYFSGTEQEVTDGVNTAISVICSLTYGSEIAKNSLPLTECDAACGNVTGENASPAPGIREFSFKLVARGSSEDNIIFQKVRRLLKYAGEPLFWKVLMSDEASSPVIVDIVPAGTWQMHKQFFGGVKVPYMVWNLLVHIGKES